MTHYSHFSDIIAVLDGKIRTMDACAVDLRANMLNLLAELTEDSQENILLGKNSLKYGLGENSF